jgi:hypothetical protein
LKLATIGAKLEDFDFEVGLNVVGFNLKVTDNLLLWFKVIDSTM